MLNAQASDVESLLLRYIGCFSLPKNPASNSYRQQSALGECLSEAHGRGIVHRDIKPENLFVTELGGEKNFIKLLDFGIAAIASNASNTVLTESGAVMGTPQFLAPEMASGLPADERSDVYSLGAVLYFLLTGVPPYAGDSLLHLLMQVARGGTPTPSERLGRPIPSDIEELTMCCLEVDPQERYQDAEALAQALAACHYSHADLEALP